ncbi:hypothetical protein, partial [Halorubrum ezzemoulense]|uniref:hypothetical protein n=1 Tax=Halorubrum ezzemoulense TaxID=337243 RepID=UPI00232E5D15
GKTPPVPGRFDGIGTKRLSPIRGGLANNWRVKSGTKIAFAKTFVGINIDNHVYIRTKGG